MHEEGGQIFLHVHQPIRRGQSLGCSVLHQMANLLYSSISNHFLKVSFSFQKSCAHFNFGNPFHTGHLSPSVKLHCYNWIDYTQDEAEIWLKVVSIFISLLNKIYITISPTYLFVWKK